MEKKWYNLAQTGSMQERITAQIKLFLEENDLYQKLKPEVKDSFRDQFPETCAFIDSPTYKTIVSILKASNPKNLGSTVASMMALWDNHNHDSTIEESDE